MSILIAARLARRQIAGLAAVGIVLGGLASLMPSLKAQIGAEDAPMGVALMMLAIGGILAMWTAPAVAQRLKRVTLPVAGMILALATCLPILSHTVPAFAAAMFVLGFCLALLDMSTNMRIAVLEAHHGRHLQNLVHGMYALSFAATAFLIGMAREAGWTPAQILPFLAGGVAVLAALTIEWRGWIASPDHRDAGGARLPWATVALVAVLLFASFVSENAVENWTALHIERTLGAAVGEGSLGPALFGLMMGLGRLSGQVLAERLGEIRLMFLGTILSIAGMVLLALAPDKATALFGASAYGLGISVIIPTGNAVLSRLVPGALRGVAISRAWMIGFAGYLFGPGVFGAIAQASSLRVSFLVFALLVAANLPVLAALRRRGA